MELEFKNLGPWIFGTKQLKRYTQDSPVMPDVWLEYGREPNDELDLLLEPFAGSTTAELAKAVLDADHTPTEPQPIELAYNQSHVAATRTFEEMLRSVLPLSNWWQERLRPAGTTSVADVLKKRKSEIIAGLKKPMREQGRRPTSTDELPGTLIWFVGLVGRIAWEQQHTEDAQPEDAPPRGLTARRLVEPATKMLGDLQRVPPPGHPVLWAINRNRPARPAAWRSRNTIKADAAKLLFDLHCAGLCWAVIDSGIDAAHLAPRSSAPTGVWPIPTARRSTTCVASVPTSVPRSREDDDFEIHLTNDAEDDDSQKGLVSHVLDFARSARTRAARSSSAPARTPPCRCASTCSTGRD